MDQDEAAQRFVKARKLSEEGSHEVALSILDPLAEEFPDSASIVLARAQCLAVLGRNAEALELCAALSGKFEDNRVEELEQSIRAAAPPVPPGASEQGVDGPIDLAEGLDLSGAGPPTLYKHSGKFGLMSPFLMIGLGVPGTLVLSLIYGMGVFYMPFIYFSVVLTLIYGAGIGGLMIGGIKLGKVRNMPVALASAAFFGVLGVYLAWVFWIFALSGRETFLISPGEITSLMSDLAEDGVWSIMGGYSPAGFVLYLIWFIEAALIVGIALILPAAYLSDHPFCEATGEWADEELKIASLAPIAEPEEFKRNLETGDWNSLFGLGLSPAGSPVTTRLTVNSAKNSEDFHVLKVESVAFSVGKKGEEKEDATDVLKNLIIPQKAFAALVDLGQRAEAALDARLKAIPELDPAVEGEPS